MLPWRRSSRKNSLLYSQAPEPGSKAFHTGSSRKKAGCQEAEGAEASGGFCHCFYRNFHRKGKAEQRKQPGLAGLNNFGGLRARRVVSSCPLPGPGMITTEEYCLPGCMGQIEMLWLWTG